MVPCCSRFTTTSLVNIEALEAYSQQFHVIKNEEDFVTWGQDYLQKKHLMLDKETLQYVSQNANRGLSPVCAIIGTSFPS